MLSLLFKMSILVFFENYVGVWSEQTKYLSTQIKFAIYRSLCCLFLFLYAVVNVFFVDKSAFLNLVYYNNPHIIDLNQWFLAYAIVDTIFMVLYKNSRIDLWIHHIIFIIGVLIYYYSFGTNLILLGEALSLFSGIDLYYIENNMMYKSYLCKKIRKSILLYLRFPIWLFIGLSCFISLLFLKFSYYYLIFCFAIHSNNIS